MTYHLILLASSATLSRAPTPISQVVHFGGYVVGKPHSQRVRIVNISRTSQRLHILGPATGCFKVPVNLSMRLAPVLLDTKAAFPGNTSMFHVLSCRRSGSLEQLSRQ